MDRSPTVVIENIQPSIEGGRYPVKRVVGESLTISADILKEGHDVTAAVLKWRPQGQEQWFETPMTPGENDRWSATCLFTENRPYDLTVEALQD